jgi:hypothetical protein
LDMLGDVYRNLTAGFNIEDLVAMVMTGILLLVLLCQIRS